MQSEAWQQDVLGDLVEEFAEVSRSRGDAWARRWFWRQCLRLTLGACVAKHRAALDSLAVLFFIGDRPMSTFAQEVRQALRSLKRQPGVTAAIILTLAIGLGVNAAIFNAIDKLLLSPFPFPGVDRMLVMSELSPDNPFPKESVSPAAFTEFAKSATAFDRLAAHRWSEANLSGGERPERVAAFGVSGAFFETLGIQPALGRLITARDTTVGEHHVVVLGDAIWRERFGADAGVVGKTVQLDGEPHVVVGVAQPDFTFPEGAQLWRPMAFTPEELSDYTSRDLTVFGHLKPGRSQSDASDELVAIYGRLKTQSPDAFRGGLYLKVQSFSAALVDVGMPTVLVLWQAAALFVLLIGCTNVINLLLAQGAERQRELAVRMALGAGRARVVRQLLIESMVIAAVSVPAALGVAWVALRAMKAAMPAALIRFIPGWDHMAVSWPLFGWTALGAIFTGALFGLIPAWQASRADALSSIKGGAEGGRSSTAGRGRNRTRRALVIAEVALALPLLVSSALAVVGVQRFVTGAQGYEPNGILRASLVLPDPAYAKDDTMRQFAERLMTEVRRIPSVTHATYSTVLPASGSNRTRTIEIEGTPIDKDRPIGVNYRNIATQYFETLRIPLIAGRDFTDQDRDGTQRVAIVSQSFAARNWPNKNPIGARLRISSNTPPANGDTWMTIVGISGDVIDDWFINRNVPTLYVPAAQAPTHYVNLAIRSAGDASRLESGLRAAVSSVDPQLPLFSVRTFPEALKERTTGLRFIGGLMATFGTIALVLAAIGVYSVMSFYVTMRRKEFGVRLALGATSSNVLRMTLTHASWLAAIGVIIGTALSIALARLMEQAMFGTVSPDPRIIGTVAAILFAVAAVSSFIPAHAATKVDPATTLRD